MALGNQRPPDFKGKKFLISIGISGYVIDGVNNTKFGPLDHAARDAERFADVLVKQCGFVEERVFRLTEGNAKKGNITDKIDDLKDERRKPKERLMPEDQIVVFFAGHGMVEENNNAGYWVAFDANDQAGRNLSVAAIVLSLTNSCAQVLLIADCCFSTLAEDAGREIAFMQKGAFPSKFFALSSTSRFKTTPDDSPFFKALTGILEGDEIVEFFSELMSPLQHQLPKSSFTAAGPTQEDGHFVLQKADRARPVLKEACWKVNFGEQNGYLAKMLVSAGTRKFNFIYLHGAAHSAHNIFLRHFFKEFKTPVELFLITEKYVITGSEADNMDKIRNCFIGRGGENNAAPSIGSIVKNNMGYNSRAFFLKIADGFDDDGRGGVLAQSLLQFWKELNETEVDAGLKIRFFFVVIDERGNGGSLDSAAFKAIDLKPHCTFYDFPPIAKLNGEVLENWKITQRDNSETPELAEIFDKTEFSKFGDDDFFITTSISKICEQWGRGGLANEVLFKK